MFNSGNILVRVRKYYQGGKTVVNQPSAIGRYSIVNVQRFINQVEEAWSVSFSFWFDIAERPGSPAVARVHSTCSGSVLDFLPDSVQPPPVDIHDSEAFSLGEALYYSVAWWIRHFDKVREPVGARPAL